MEALVRVFEELILPPGCILVMLLIAIILRRRRPRTSNALLGIAFLALYLLSTSFIAGLIADQLEVYPPLQSANEIVPKPAAIVVLSGNRNENAIEYSGETVGKQTLARIRYGAHLQRLTGLPILVSGGIPGEASGLTLAQLMAQVLREELNAGEIWLESRSTTTAENAFFSKSVLAQRNIDRIFLVTDAWHMPRSVFIFEKAGFDVIPAPTAFAGNVPLEYSTLLPRAGGLLTSRQTIREFGGIAWYRIRH